MSNLTEQTMQHQYLTFLLAKDLYALEIAAVQEVREFQTITKIPQTSEYMLGVINLRDQAIPVIDLSLKFEMPKSERTVDTCIIIIEDELHGIKSTFGLLVDGVEEVIHIDPENINPPPKIGTRIDTDFIDGIGKLENNFVILININKILNLEEVNEIAECDKLNQANQT